MPCCNPTLRARYGASSLAVVYGESAGSYQNKSGRGRFYFCRQEAFYAPRYALRTSAFVSRLAPVSSSTSRPVSST